MVFKCQEDSFLKEFTSNVLSCEKAQLDTVVNGKKSKIDGYEVVLKDTILFPEGGGQPSDHGFLNDKKVLQVNRRGAEAVHFINEPLAIGEDVKQTVDWQRRFDHMQQHSGQHLITAVIEREFGFPTSSWWLGDEVSHIELDAPSISTEQINNTEGIVNEAIRNSTKVTVTVYKEGDTELTDARTRGLPEDHKGDVRVITIAGIDSNMCCGTHVTNLSQLQSIKLLYAEKGKRKNKTLLYFLVGNRVLKQLNSCLEREQKITALLKNGPPEHVDLIDKLQKNMKIVNKNLQSVLKDVVVFEAAKLKSQSPAPKYFSLYRKEAEPDFMSWFVKEIGSTSIFLFLSVGEEKGSGNILMYGEEKAIADLGNKICEVLNGKGAGKGNRFQAKVTKMEYRNKVEEMLKEYFA